MCGWYKERVRVFFFIKDCFVWNNFKYFSFEEYIKYLRIVFILSDEMNC